MSTSSYNIGYSISYSMIDRNT